MAKARQPKGRCECGCGKATTRMVYMLPVQHLGTVAALHGQTTGMTEPVYCLRGHDECVAGYVQHGKETNDGQA